MRIEHRYAVVLVVALPLEVPGVPLVDDRPGHALQPGVEAAVLGARAERRAVGAEGDEIVLPGEVVGALGDEAAEGPALRLGGAALVAVAVAAVQLVLGLDVAAESIRQAGVGYEFATSFSFPPENLLFLIYEQDLFGLPTYTIGIVLLVVASILTIVSMMVYIKSAWSTISEGNS